MTTYLLRALVMSALGERGEAADWLMAVLFVAIVAGGLLLRREGVV